MGKWASPLLLLMVCMLPSAQLAAQAIEQRAYYDQEELHLKEVYYVADSVSGPLNGRYTSYFYSGGIESEGEYMLNKPSGTWQYYFENGRLKMTGQLEAKQDAGYWKYYFENGNQRMEGRLEAGKREGVWQYFFENGDLKQTGAYTNGVVAGIWNYFYEGGKLKAQAYYEQGEGIYKEYYLSGELKAEGKNINNKSDSVWNFYYPEGTLKANGAYLNGQKQGLWRYYHSNGVISGEGDFDAGTKVGSWHYYHDNGSLASIGTEKDGQKEGYWKLYYETGALLGEGEYEQGSGGYKEYYESGKIKVEGRFQKGVKEGKWYYYYEDGSLEGVALFTHGAGKYTGYYDDGSLKMEGNIKDEKKVGKWKLYNKDQSLAGYYNPIYEEEAPAFKVDADPIRNSDSKKAYEKPEYLFRSKQVRYFTPRVNEYRAVVLATNPLSSLLGSLPVGLEYYYQERLGYELYFQYLQSPFFTPGNDVRVGKLYKQGFSLALRQKLYSASRRYGMFYFGHQVGYTDIRHAVNQRDAANGSLLTFRTTESRIEYGVFIGNRFVRDAGTGGLTLDMFAGAAFGYRNYNNSFGSSPAIASLFEDLNQKSLSVQVLFGINIGLMGPPKKSSTLK